MGYNLEFMWSRKKKNVGINSFNKILRGFTKIDVCVGGYERVMGGSVWVYVFGCTCENVFVCVHVRVFICVYVYVCISIYVCMHMYVYRVCLCMFIYILKTHSKSFFLSFNWSIDIFNKNIKIIIMFTC